MAKSKHLQQLILFESIDYAYRDINNAIKTFWVIFATYLTITWGSFSYNNIAIAIILLTLLFINRQRILSAYIKDKNAFNNISKWQKKLLIITALSGCTMGYIALFFYPANAPSEQTLFYVMIMGVVAGSVPTYGHYLPLFILTCIPMYIGLSINLIHDGSNISLSMLVGSTVFFIFMYRVAKIHHDALEQVTTTNYNNQQLIKQLENKNKQIVKINQDKATFLADASHDIRQPVHALSLFIDAIEKQHQSQKNQELIGNMKKSLLVLKNYLMSILDSAKIDAKTIKINNESINLALFIDEIKQQHINTAKDNNIDFRVKASNKVVTLESTILKTVLAHVLDNAFKYAANKKVLLTAKIHNKQVRFQILDTGLGIKQSDQIKIFKDYSKLETKTGSHQSGLGLGLSISKKMLAIISGHIQVKSTLGKGSCFTITIPLNLTKHQKSTSSVDPLPILELNNKHILVIDDEKMVLNAMASILKKWGCNVSLANDYDSAINSLNGSKPDFIISDYRLEKEDGISLITRLKTNWSSPINTLIITGDTTPEKLKLFKQHELKVLYKPLQAAQLRVALNSFN